MVWTHLSRNTNWIGHCRRVMSHKKLSLGELKKMLYLVFSSIIFCKKKAICNICHCIAWNFSCEMLFTTTQIKKLKCRLMPCLQGCRTTELYMISGTYVLYYGSVQNVLAVIQDVVSMAYYLWLKRWLIAFLKWHFHYGRHEKQPFELYISPHWSPSLW